MKILAGIAVSFLLFAAGFSCWELAHRDQICALIECDARY